MQLVVCDPANWTDWEKPPHWHLRLAIVWFRGSCRPERGGRLRKNYCASCHWRSFETIAGLPWLHVLQAAVGPAALKIVNYIDLFSCRGVTSSSNSCRNRLISAWSFFSSEREKITCEAARRSSSAVPLNYSGSWSFFVAAIILPASSAGSDDWCKTRRSVSPSVHAGQLL